MFKNSPALSKYYQDTSNENREKEIEKMLEDETGHSFKNQVTITKLETGYLVDGRHAFSDLDGVLEYIDCLFDDLWSSDIWVDEPNSDDWIEWHGGKCPVDPETKVRLRLRDGEETLYDHWKAGDCPWHHEGASDDIIAYRVVKQ